MTNLVYIAFRLSMPSNNAWNNKWSGAEKLYVRTKAFSRASAGKILEKRDYRYNFGDGRCASVSVSEISGEEKRRLDKQTAGFCGYDWMIDSIIQNGKIQAD